MVFNPFHFYIHENLTDQLVFKVGEFNWFSKQGDKVNNPKQGDTEKIKFKAGRYWMLFSIVIFQFLQLRCPLKNIFFQLFYFKIFKVKYLGRFKSYSNDFRLKMIVCFSCISSFLYFVHYLSFE
jgi:hypothetical protein